MHIQYDFGSFHQVKVYDQDHFLGFLSLTVVEPKAQENVNWLIILYSWMYTRMP